MKAALCLLLSVCASLFGAEVTYSFTAEPLWDFSGDYEQEDTANSSTFTYEVSHTPRGVLAINYHEQVAGDTAQLNGFGQFFGRVRSTRDGVVMKYAGTADGSGTINGAHATLRIGIRAMLVLSDRTLSGVSVNNGCVTRNGVRRCAVQRTDHELNIFDKMTGAWMLALNVNTNGNTVAGNATVTLSNGRTITFSTSGRRVAKGNYALRLVGNGDAVGTSIRLVTDGAFSLRKVTGRLFGQAITVRR